MDTLIFSGLLFASLAVMGQKRRSLVLGVWWLLLVVTLLLLAHHITGGLSLGLSY
ncbi:DUF5993 family protein [Streptomyces sp. NPDC003077]|uniref:DUF5993 family protein n=1 Tax=Streptomyces sp. NPDC003077 TaxID=3154443 RepID=UPI0033B3A578